MEKLLKNKFYIAVFVLPALLIYSVTFVFPLLQTAYSSLFKWDGIGEMKFLLFDNYIEALSNDANFWPSVKNTVIMVVMSVFLQLPAAFALAYILSRKIKGAAVFRKIYFIPVILSTTVISVLWMKLYDMNFGLVNEVFKAVGLEGWRMEWLAEPGTVVFCVFLSVAWQYIGYHMLIMYAGLKSIPDSYYESARIDGANAFRIIRSVVLPLLSNVLKVDLVIAVTGSLKIFDNVFIMTKGGPYNSSNTLALLMYNEAFSKMKYGYGSALAVLLVAECLVIAYVINKIVAKESFEF